MFVCCGGFCFIWACLVLLVSLKISDCINTLPVPLVFPLPTPGFYAKLNQTFHRFFYCFLLLSLLPLIILEKRGKKTQNKQKSKTETQPAGKWLLSRPGGDLQLPEARGGPPNTTASHTGPAVSNTHKPFLRGRVGALCPCASCLCPPAPASAAENHFPMTESPSTRAEPPHRDRWKAQLSVLAPR